MSFSFKSAFVNPFRIVARAMSSADICSSFKYMSSNFFVSSAIVEVVVSQAGWIPELVNEDLLVSRA